MFLDPVVMSEPEPNPIAVLVVPEVILRNALLPIATFCCPVLLAGVMLPIMADSPTAVLSLPRILPAERFPTAVLEPLVMFSDKDK